MPETLSAVPETLSVDDLRDLAKSWAVMLRGRRKSANTVAVYLRSLEQYLTFCDSVDGEPLRKRTLERSWPTWPTGAGREARHGPV